MNTNGGASYFPPQPERSGNAVSGQGYYSDSLQPSAAPADSLANDPRNGNQPHPSSANNNNNNNGGRFTEQWDAAQRGSSIIGDYGDHLNGHDQTDGAGATNHRPQSFVEGDDAILNGGASETNGAMSLPKRSNTLKKKASLSRGGSLKRSSSRRSMRAGSVRSLALQSNSDPDEMHSVFHCPVPTSGNPTEVLANRFQAWRKVLKDLIGYFRELAVFYEQRTKSLTKLAGVANSIVPPAGFLSPGGLEDALDVLRHFNRESLVEAQRAREIEQEVILSLTGLRSDLQLKIKEIKNLSGDFKNSVEKEMDNTRRAVKSLQEGLGQNELDPALTVGKQDPYLLRLAVDRQVWRQLEEENYLHQAYLNLENSGRELESIVVGEIQKAYGAYARILKAEADTANSTVEELRIGPVMMPKDQEWNSFVKRDDQFVDPNIPIRSMEYVHYPGRDHPSCQEIRAGLLERKSKYLRSYTAGWYVLSPTHLHEFKSADKGQAPVMSLYLPEQKLGSHSTEGSSSNKFVVKGRQTGAMHRGHTWVFRAESHDTMMAWYEDIKALTEKTAEERSGLARGHARSLSRSSRRSISSDGVVDEDDEEPFSANSTINVTPGTGQKSNRHMQPPGGRFPSDIQVNAQRGLQAPHSPSSVSSGRGLGGPETNRDLDTAAAAGSAALAARAFPGTDRTGEPDPEQARDHPSGYGSTARTPMEDVPSHATVVARQAREDGVNPYRNDPWKGSAAHGSSSRGGGEPASPSAAAVLPGGGERGASSEYSTEARETGRDDASGLADDTTLVAAADADSTRHVSGEAGDGGSGKGGEGLVRPSARTGTNVSGLSNLHVPGEYPKAPAAGDA